MASEDEIVAAFHAKLASLNASAQSIETLSHWCVFHRKRARELARAWATSMERAPKARALAHLYLASDAAQRGKKKGGEWVEALVEYLPDACKRAAAEGGEIGEKIRRLLGVWDERGVFPGASPKTWLDGASGGGGVGSGNANAKSVSVAGESKERSNAPVKRGKNELAEIPAALSGEYAALAKLLVKMEKAERDVASAKEFEVDIQDGILDESAVDASENPVATLRAIQRCESAIVAKRDAVDAFDEILDDLEAKLRAALARVETARAEQGQVGALTQKLVKALKARKKASKAAAAHVVQEIASGGGDDAGGDAHLPEPVDFNDDDDNYDPSDEPDESARRASKRRRD